MVQKSFQCLSVVMVVVVTLKPPTPFMRKFMMKAVSEDLLHLRILIVCPIFLSHWTDTYLIFSHSPSFSVLVIAAAGNSAQDSWGYPAGYPTVMSVGSVTSSGSLSSFSTQNEQVEITGPGSSVKSTVPNNQYDTYSGTSMVRLLNCWACLFCCLSTLLLSFILLLYTGLPSRSWSRSPLMVTLP